MTSSYDLQPTWAAAPTGRRLNFGHQTETERLFALDATGWPAWRDGGTRLSPDQFAAMPAAQRAEVLARVPASQRAAIACGLAAGDASRARAEAPACDSWQPAEAKAPPKRGNLPAPDRQLASAVRAAAQRATQKNQGRRAACYDTANRSAKLAGGRDLDGARDILAARNLPLTHLRASADAGSLKVGMAVYMNLAPGSNPRSINNETRPHWATYLGKDDQGVMRFSDQYRADWSLAELAQAYAPRRIDLFVDPFAGRR